MRKSASQSAAGDSRRSGAWARLIRRPLGSRSPPARDRPLRFRRRIPPRPLTPDTCPPCRRCAAAFRRRTRTRKFWPKRRRRPEVQLLPQRQTTPRLAPLALLRQKARMPFCQCQSAGVQYTPQSDLPARRFPRLGRSPRLFRPYIARCTRPLAPLPHRPENLPRPTLRCRPASGPRPVPAPGHLGPVRPAKTGFPHLLRRLGVEGRPLSGGTFGG